MLGCTSPLPAAAAAFSPAGWGEGGKLLSQDLQRGSCPYCQPWGKGVRGAGLGHRSFPGPARLPSCRRSRSAPGAFLHLKRKARTDTPALELASQSRRAALRPHAPPRLPCEGAGPRQHLQALREAAASQWRMRRRRLAPRPHAAARAGGGGGWRSAGEGRRPLGPRARGGYPSRSASRGRLRRRRAKGEGERERGRAGPEGPAGLSGPPVAPRLGSNLGAAVEARGGGDGLGGGDAAQMRRLGGETVFFFFNC